MKGFRLKVVRIESEIVYRLHHFFYKVYEKLADIHSEIVERGIKIIEGADE